MSVIRLAPQDTTHFFSNDKTFIIPTSDLYLLGILNSRLAWLFLKRVCSVLGDPDKGGRLELRAIYLSKFPVRSILPADNDAKAHHDRMVQLVQRMLDLHKSLAAAQTPNEKTALQRQIKTTDQQIDKLVYKLYDLTEEEIRIVEGVSM